MIYICFRTEEYTALADLLGRLTISLEKQDENDDPDFDFYVDCDRLHYATDERNFNNLIKAINKIK